MYPKRYKSNDGIITGRNGTWDITAVEISSFHDKARIDGVGKRDVTIRGGISMDAVTMDQIALDWLKHRNLIGDSPS